MHATGEEYSRPQPVCDREMKALEIFFEAMHGKVPDVGTSTQKKLRSSTASPVSRPANQESAHTHVVEDTLALR